MRSLMTDAWEVGVPWIMGRCAEFVRLTNGQFTAPIEEPDSSGGSTYVMGLNSTGTTSGYYETDSGEDGFLYSDSTFTTVQIDPSYTYLQKINDAGNYCGFSFSGGFVSIGGIVTRIGIPGANGTAVYGAAVYGINNLDQVAGYYSIGDTTYSF
jgi:hypothetical protein